MSTAYRLVLKSGPDAGKIFPIESTQVSLGREQSNDIAISDPEISRRHAHIFLQGENYVIEDLGSTNGTAVNGQRLVGPYILRPGELITLGENTHLLFEAVVVDPDATRAAGQPEPQAVYPGPQKPLSAAYQPAYQAPVDQTPAGAFSGRVPASPARPSQPKKRKLSSLVIALIVVLVLFLCGCVAFFIFDALNLYCEFPGIMNLLIPGACPP